MKRISIFLILAAIFFVSNVCVQAQNVSDTYQVGSKKIVIPAPPNFTEATSRIQVIKDRFVLTESVQNELLAVHIRNEDFQLFEKGEVVNLSFYTKVSVSKKIKDTAITKKDFADFVAVLRSGFPTMTDPDGSLMKKELDRLSGKLSDHNQEKTSVLFDKPYALGEIEEKDVFFGIIALTRLKMSVGDNENVVPLVVGISAIRVRERIVFIYTFKNYKDEQDVADLKDLTSNWLKQIVAANK